MKPFDLDKALAGEPVVLRNGLKAYIKYNLEDYQELDFDFPLRGFLISEGNAYERSWTIDGLSFFVESKYDVIGMWEEPRPTVTLTLPYPLKEPQDDMWYINTNGTVAKSTYSKTSDSAYWGECFNARFYFSSKEDAQAWLDAMRNSRG